VRAGALWGGLQVIELLRGVPVDALEIHTTGKAPGPLPPRPPPLEPFSSSAARLGRLTRRAGAGALGRLWSGIRSWGRSLRLVLAPPAQPRATPRPRARAARAQPGRGRAT